MDGEERLRETARGTPSYYITVSRTWDLGLVDGDLEPKRGIDGMLELVQRVRITRTKQYTFNPYYKDGVSQQAPSSLNDMHP